MLKLLAMLLAFLLVALSLLSLRQRRLELTAETAQIYSKIRDAREGILGQDVKIAQATNPPTLAKALQDSGMDPGAVLPHPRPGNNRTPTPTVETDLIDPVR